YDYPVERRIQLVNTLVFSYLALALSVSAYLWITHSGERIIYVLIASTYPLLLINMAHSEELSLMPKFLLKNAPDAPDRLVQRFRADFFRAASGMADDDIKKIVSQTTAKGFKALKTRRARSRDVDRVVDGLLREFGYVFEYIFHTKDAPKLNRAVRALLTVAGGFGSFGYMNFYLLLGAEPGQAPQPVGFIKLETPRRYHLYRCIEVILLPLALAVALRSLRLFGVWQRAQNVAASQEIAEKEEIHLTYLSIFPEFRNQGFGCAAMTMIVNALVHNVTNDVAADRLTLVVREKNLHAQALFRQVGFVPRSAPAEASADPFSDLEGIGKPIALEYSRGKS
ncbi:MAG TPA: GNAT family N-acetyltransferase, partial [Opitutaceae bacterium]|nr:GNAT family N-acetyltransferase [Opitutaceae bacterium]